MASATVVNTLIFFQTYSSLQRSRPEGIDVIPRRSARDRFAPGAIRTMHRSAAFHNFGFFLVELNKKDLSPAG